MFRSRDGAIFSEGYLIIERGNTERKKKNAESRHDAKILGK